MSDNAWLPNLMSQPKIPRVTSQVSEYKHMPGHYRNPVLAVGNSEHEVSNVSRSSETTDTRGMSFPRVKSDVITGTGNIWPDMAGLTLM